MADRPFWPPGAEIAAQAFQAFDEWLVERGECLGTRDVLEQATDFHADRMSVMNIQKGSV